MGKFEKGFGGSDVDALRCKAGIQKSGIEFANSKSQPTTHLVCTGNLVDSLIHRQKKRVALVELDPELVLGPRDGALIGRKLTLDCTRAIPSRVELLLRLAKSLRRAEESSTPSQRQPSTTRKPTLVVSSCLSERAI